MKQIILRIGIVLIAVLFIGSSVVNHNKSQIASDAKVYMNENFPTVNASVTKVTLHLDDIREVTFEEALTSLTFNVYIRNRTIYDNYLRSKLEAQMKREVLPLLTDIKEKHITLFLDVSFEDDHLLQRYIDENKVMNYTLSINHKGEYDHDKISDIYSDVSQKVFSELDNIDIVIIKNYDKHDKELYLFIDRSELKDISKDTIKAYILEQEIFYDK